MSRKNNKGEWVVPERQVKEFMSNDGPDYDLLIQDCLDLYKRRKTKIKIYEDKTKKRRLFSRR